jgi:hypothetical protein
MSSSQSVCYQELELEPGVSFWEQYCPTCSKSYRDEFHVAIERYKAGKFEDALEVCRLGPSLPYRLDHPLISVYFSGFK